MVTIEKDVYVAHHGNKGAYIAMDEYSISQIPSGFLIESNNTIFGANGFQQKAVLRTDFNWQLQELKVAIESMKVEMHASMKDGKVYIQQIQQDIKDEKIIILQNENNFFMYSGAMVIPMIWLRGFNFDNYEKVIYQMLPMGYAEVKQLQNTGSDQGIRNFSVIICLQYYTDLANIQTDMKGKLLLLHSETNQLTIKIKP